MIHPYLNVLSNNECQEIMYNSLPHLTPLIVETEEGPKVDKTTRVGDGLFLTQTPSPPIIQKIKEIVSTITNLPVSHQEMPNIVKYKVGGKYEPHHDFMSYLSGQRCENDRKYTCMIYLNDAMEGGDTYFPNYKLKISPTKGTLVAWENLYPDGTPNPDSLHAGLPVTKGEKWILVIWVREKPLC